MIIHQKEDGQVGKTILHYKIIEKLGEGGMGVVYKAHDTKLDRYVALKFLPLHVSKNADERQRFIHEAKAASAFDHNNICTIYEINETKPAPGEPGDEQMFIAMAYYEGETLKEKIERSPLKLNDAVGFAIQIAQGLAKAHEQGIVHRDIKPANVHVTNDGVAKILDFGLAKLGDRSKLTKEGTTLGTAAYMSPEQARGEDVDFRTDIWSLGIVIYEMITGQLPFKGDYEQAVMYAIMNEAPEPMTGLRTGVPLELERIVNKALSKRPDERYQHVDEMQVDLRAIRNQLRIEKTRERSTQTKTVKRKPLYLFIGLVIFIALVTLIGIYFFSWQSESIDSIAVLPLKSLSDDPEQEIFTAGMHEALIAELSKIGALRTISRTSVMRYKETIKSIPEIAIDLDVDAVVEGSVLHSGEKVRIIVQLIGAVPERHLWAQTFDRDLGDVLALHSEVTRQIADQIQVEITHDEETRLQSVGTVNSAAYETYLLGRHYFRNGDFLAGLGVEYFERAIETDSTFAPAYAGLALAYASLGAAHNIIAPHDTWPKVRQAAEKAVALNEGLAEAHTALALVKKSEWDWIGAEREYKRALELNPNSVEVLRSYGFFMELMGRVEKAMKLRERSIKLDPYSLGGLRTVIKNLVRSGHAEEAIQLISNKIKSDPGEPLMYWDLAEIYAKEGDYEAAIKQLQIQISLMKGDIVDEVAFLGHLYGRLGRKKDAFKMLQKLEQLSTKDQYVSPALKAWVYSGMNDKDKAIEWLTRGYETRAHRMGLNIKRFSFIFDPISDDPRFRKLMGKMNLKP